MVNADLNHNYYADLGLAPDADDVAIREQYRKLARIWHPDRNLGREAECKPRFQAIQAAHEVLSDPVERTKYDLERRKRGLTAAYTPGNPAPRGNPYQAPYDFRPPRRRAGGNSPFTNFPKPPPTQRRGNNSGDRNANVFTAWQSMKGKPGAHTTPTGQAGSSHWRAKSAWEFANEQQKAGVNRSHSTSTRKKGGFDPTTPGADEPPAASTSSYLKTSNYGRPTPPPPRDAGTTNPAGARQPPVDPLKQCREQLQKEPAFPEDMRTRTPYHGAGGERISVYPVRRSASSAHREQNATGAGLHGASGSPRHSASPPRHKGNSTCPFSMYSSSEEDEPTGPSQKAAQPGQQGETGGNGNATQNSSTYELKDNIINGGTGQKNKSSTYGHFIPQQPCSTSKTPRINTERFCPLCHRVRMRIFSKFLQTAFSNVVRRTHFLPFAMHLTSSQLKC